MSVANGFPADLLRCKSAQDCTAVSGICAGWVPVSVKMKSALSETYQNMGTAIDCAQRERTPMPPLICQSSLCQFDEAKPTALEQTTAFQKSCPDAKGEVDTVPEQIREQILQRLQHPLSQIRKVGLNQISQLELKQLEPLSPIIQMIVAIYRRNAIGEENGLSSCWFAPTDKTSLQKAAISLGSQAGPIADVVLETMPPEKNYYERKQILRFLGDLGAVGGARAIETIRKCLDQGDVSPSLMSGGGPRIPGGWPEIETCIYAARMQNSLSLVKPLSALLNENISSVQVSALLAIYGLIDKGPEFRSAVLQILDDKNCEPKKMALRLVALEPAMFEKDVKVVLQASRESNACGIQDVWPSTVMRIGKATRDFLKPFPPRWSKDPWWQNDFKVWKKVFSADELAQSPELVKDAFDSFASHEARQVLKEINSVEARNLLLEMNLYWSTGKRGKNASVTFEQMKQIALNTSQAPSIRTAALGYLFYDPQLRARAVPIFESLLKDQAKPVKWDSAGMLLIASQKANPQAVQIVLEASELGGYVRSVDTLDAFKALPVVPAEAIPKILELFKKAGHSEAGALLVLAAYQGNSKAIEEVKKAAQGDDISALQSLLKGIERTQVVPSVIEAKDWMNLLQRQDRFDLVANTLTDLSTPQYLDLLRRHLKLPQQLRPRD
ncbi:MAG: hypothetical protein JNL11_10880 [Bdellovibrionaceae bacterium]|nr:hypothetical protein [Pseudobdellovibrionaceae bacterium]